MKRKGFILVEILVATTLISMVAGGVYTGLSQASKVRTRILETDVVNDPFKILWLTASQDLRNMIALREHPFVGKQEEIIFPSFAADDHVTFVRYFLKSGELIREEGKKKEVLVKGVEKLRFFYPYLDADEKLSFKSLWPEEPYLGIPKSVRWEIKLKNDTRVFSRLVAIPQGKWGHEQQ